MFDEPERQESGQPDAARLLRGAQQVDDWEMTQPEKVEILRINNDSALVRVLAADGEVESRVVEL